MVSSGPVADLDVTAHEGIKEIMRSPKSPENTNSKSRESCIFVSCTSASIHSKLKMDQLHAHCLGTDNIKKTAWTFHALADLDLDWKSNQTQTL